MLRIKAYLSAVILVVSGCSGGADGRTPESDDEREGGDVLSADTESSGGDIGVDGSMDGESKDGGDASEHRFRITSPRSSKPVEYRLHVVTEPTKVRDGSRFQAEENNDTISSRAEHWVITGETGTSASANEVYGDSYRWPRASEPMYAIAGWQTAAPASDYTITIDGETFDPDTLPEISDDSVSGCLGGGECYTEKVTAVDADVTVGASADLERLQQVLGDASSGEVIFIDPGAEIDLGYFPDAPSIEIPAGVTLASDRGVDGSEGARLFGGKKPGSDWQGSDTIRVNEGVRITGLRIEGPTPDRDMNWLGADHDYTDGIDVGGSGDVEIDNNELYGWPAAAVSGGDPVYVHHNYIHDNDQSGLGYGVSSTQWDSVIEYNRFERNRHAVAGSGEAGDGYIVRYNTFGAEGIGGAGHKIDMHEHDNTGDAGTRMEIYRNTVEFADAQAVYLRATPRESAEIHNNWFYNDREPCLTRNEGGGYCAIQVRADSFENVSYSENHYGSMEPSCDIGAPRDGC